jgi:hypothetical protein
MSKGIRGRLRRTPDNLSDLEYPNLFTQEEPMKIIYFCGVLIILLIASSHFNQWRE